ncbi:MAG: hypothetical protein KC425_09495, partial [Anaerolineales bacterium]|nr:hypothetical protein [Anaerolineales bacterium]
VILLIAGIHGGYEWNTILLAYELIDYLHENPDVIPPNVTLFVIPSANPDGQLLVTGTADRFTPADVAANTVPGRFNANGVDLNRNWPCNWTPQGTWRDQPVSGGSAELSEPENHALFNFIIRQQPVATVFYHSALNAIFTAGCPDTFPPSRELADVYATAASYPVYEQFTSYAVTGDAGDWMARVGYAAFTVELSTHQSLDWTRNLEGILALLAHFS